jgi:deoxyadenosine/deoxycytidine kinase
LCLGTKYNLGLEQHEERPFQELFMHHKKKYALANQIDYMLFRAQQEITIREGINPGIQDGGLDQDFYVFTKLFFHNGYLSEDEFGICKRCYRVLRTSLPAPNLIIWMKAPVETIVERYNRRARRLDITQTEDMEVVERLLENWLSKIPSESVYVINSEREEQSYSKVIPVVRKLIESKI